MCSKFIKFNNFVLDELEIPTHTKPTKKTKSNSPEGPQFPDSARISRNMTKHKRKAKNIPIFSEEDSNPSPEAVAKSHHACASEDSDPASSDRSLSLSTILFSLSKN